MKPKMTIDEALEFADEWSRGLTIHEGSQGWRIVCMLLAADVRRMREQIAAYTNAVNAPDDAERGNCKNEAQNLTTNNGFVYNLTTEKDMIHVTDVILTMSLLEEAGEDDKCPAVEMINAWLSERSKGELKRVDDFAGGRKAIQAAVFMGAFNYLDIPEFFAAVDAASWEDRDGLAVFVKDENDERFADMTPNAKFTGPEAASPPEGPCGMTG